MPKAIRIVILLIFTFSFFFSYFGVSQTEGAISSCSASSSPHSMAPDQERTITFQVTNTDSVDIRWLGFSRPTADYTVLSVSISGWSDQTHDGGSNITGGALGSGQTLSFQANIRAGSATTSPDTWYIEASDDPSGSGAILCSGNLSIVIAEGDTTPPQISNVSTLLNGNSATISWVTNESATSVLNYGPTQSYGSVRTNNSLNTNHSFTLNGLAYSSVYHFQVQSSDAEGNSASSADNTFVTPAAQSQTNQSSSSNSSSDPGIVDPNTSPINSGVKKLEKPLERVKPTLFLEPIAANPVRESPIFKGKAADETSLFTVEFSTDGGKNWLPVSKAVFKNVKEVEFEFKPANLADGDFVVLVRAVDTSGNETLSEKIKLIIDQLPPLIGPAIFSVGPQVLRVSEADQKTHVVQGMEQKVTLSAIGGATKVWLEAASKNHKEKPVFNLTKTDEGSWVGVTSFLKQDDYEITAISEDGAENRVQKNLGEFSVSESGRVLDKEKRPVSPAKITVYYFEPTVNDWVVWDGRSFDQKNPQIVDSLGRFLLLLPKGKYFLKTEAEGKKESYTNIFTLDQSTAISSPIWLEPKPGLQIGKFRINLPLPLKTFQDISFQKSKEKSVQKGLVGQGLPTFELPSSNEEKVNSILLEGKPTLLSFVNTWDPASNQQLPILAALQKNTDLNILPITIFENKLKTKVHANISGYELEFLTDGGEVANLLEIKSLPTHLFVSRKGIVKEVKVGVLSEEELINELSGL